MSKERPYQSQSQTSEYMQTLPMLDQQALNRYMEAAKSIVILVNRSADSHVKYVNPFAGSTIWLAAAVHLVFSVFCPPGTSKSLVNSNFKVLRSNYSQFIDYWKTSSALQMNIDLLESQLRNFRETKITAQRHRRAPGNGLVEPNSVVRYENAQPPRTVEEEGAATLQSLGERWSYQNEDQQKQPSAYMPQLSPTQGIQQLQRLSGLDESYDPTVPSSVVIDNIGFSFDFGGSGDLPQYLNGLLSGSFIE
jgi:hypothetical protein